MAINLLAIVGQTASGKSSLALEIATKVMGEIVAADSKTIYKGLDIGTAKPTPSEQELVKHHLLDIIDTEETFNVARFQELALKAIKEIEAKGRLPILVGGSGLYIDSILCNYDFSKQSGEKPELRRRLEKLTIHQLQAEIRRRSLVMPENKLNRRYLIRTLERGVRSGLTESSNWREDVLAIGLRHERAVLERRIRDRLQVMLELGLLSEAKRVFDDCLPTSEAAKSNIYAALRPYFEQSINLNEALEDFVKRDLALAKKQLTWFKRHHQIKWFDDFQSAHDYILQKLNDNKK